MSCLVWLSEVQSVRQSASLSILFGKDNGPEGGGKKEEKKGEDGCR